MEVDLVVVGVMKEEFGVGCLGLVGEELERNWLVWETRFLIV